MSKALRLALAGGLAMLAGGAAAFGYAVHQGRARPAAAGEAPEVAVAVSGASCQPMQITVPAGRTTFVISNRGDRVLEWEILDGVMVVDERENIAPGLTQRLTATLVPGTYAMTCGQLSGPRGSLTVLGTQGDGLRRPTLEELVGPAAEYRAWTAGQAASSGAGTGGLLAPAAAALGLPVPADGAQDASATLRAALGGRLLLPADMARGARAALDGDGAARALPGIAKVVELLLPLAEAADPHLAARLRLDLGAADAAAQAEGGVPAGPRTALGADLDALAGLLAVDAQEASR